MAMVKICDGRTQLYRWDTGVKVEMCGCASVTECHFVTADGVIRRDVVDNVCDVPDAALTKAGLLVVYAFSRTEDEGTTRHEFRIAVLDRPKPADYIDPPDEYENLDALAERVAELIPGGGGSVTPEQIASAVEDYLTENPVEVEETDPTVPEWAKAETKPTYTAEEVGALPADTVIPEQYVLPVATADTLGGVKVGAGLEMNGDVLGVVPDGEYELIETITVNEEGIRQCQRTQTPSGENYNYKKIMVKVISEGQEAAITIAFSAYYTSEEYLYDFNTTAIRKTYDTITREFFIINTDGTMEIDALTGSWAVSGVSVSNNRRYKQEGKDINTSFKKIHMSTSADIPVGTVFEIWGVRADA